MSAGAAPTPHRVGASAPGIAGGGILAAGRGSRLRRDGFVSAKPLVSVGGVPLVEHAIENFLAARIAPLAIIFNESEDDCVRFVRERFPTVDLDVAVRTTASTLESFREISAGLPAGRILVATVDAWCPPEEFVRFVVEAAALPDAETVVAVMAPGHDDRPLRVRREGSEGRVAEIGGVTGDAVTAGIFLFSSRARLLEAPRGLERLRDFLRWLVQSGEPIRAISMEDMIDVDRGSDVRLADALAGRRVLQVRMSAERTPAGRIAAWGIFRETEHSPGRETDDALVLRAVAGRLKEEGFSVSLKTSAEASAGEADPPPFLFVMCQRPEILATLERWERRGAFVVNRPEAIRNTDRHRTASLFARDGIPFPASVLVSTSDDAPIGPSGSTDLAGCWIKRGDAHKTQASDVSRARDREDGLAALRNFARRGIPRALLQEHVPGDLVKFYGLGSAGPNPSTGEPRWFEWFYHRDQVLARHPFDVHRLTAAARRAAGTLGLEVWGGDAVVGSDGIPILIDLNAWPSFALYRETASIRIASWIASRFRQAASDRGSRAMERAPSPAVSEA